jgi:ABC-type multidrug transport system fused ATPase/permease subunit
VIQEGLLELARGRTTLIIAHRLSTIQDAVVILLAVNSLSTIMTADRLVVLRDWKVAQTGSHEEYNAPRF